MIHIELDEEMDMPCLCDCGQWFDLNDGYTSLLEDKKLICPECYQNQVNSQVEVGELRKGDRFHHQGDQLTVLTRYTKKAECLIAVNEFGLEEKLYYQDDLVVKIN